MKLYCYNAFIIYATVAFMPRTTWARLGSQQNETEDANEPNESRNLDEEDCVDSPVGWFDSDGSEFNCEWYASAGEFCSQFGDDYERLGKTANQACCACGGGERDGGAITYDSVKNTLLGMGYKFFTGKYNINLVGIRGPNRNAGSWDDTFCMLYQDDQGSNQIMVSEEFTTDPGVYYLEHPLKENGCAIVAPGQHRSVYEIGMHGDSNPYEALVQTGAKISVYRDNNKDSKLDMRTESIERGWFGINLHHGYNSDTVGENSAGCQVFKSPSDLTAMLDICKKQKPNGYGSRFTYTVIDESNLILTRRHSM